MILVDVGVWLAAVWARHIHHEVAAGWVDRQSDDLAFCRVTQTGLLRLLSNRAVMGADVLERAAAWDVLDALTADERVVWREEPAGLDTLFRAFSARSDDSHKLWTDDYLAAFAQSSVARLATLDRRMVERYPSVRVISVQ
ncbi:TA system VapC family ribonuclease toxin [Gordonia sp. (in: high G+C Gram-positive bacteria)]|uniref:TA system VapC family ribonuclease toxin n=1 Tax=Gordonia sp. (in: high G+C Gram-positive bacteria) TaxID=84139 RepID=UPI0039E5B5CF